MQAIQASVACARVQAKAPGAARAPCRPVSAFGAARFQAAPRTRFPPVAAPARRAAHVARADPRPWTEKDCKLVLSDGSVFKGRSFGAKGTAVGEVVFNTSITGYQEIMTDPSYAGQFVCFTHPHIGNVGINEDDEESTKCHLGGVIVRDNSPIVSNYRATKSLPEYLEEQGVLGIADVDTRALTRVVRNYGCLNGVITTDLSKSDEELVAMAKEFDIVGKDLIATVTTDKVYDWNNGTIEEWEFSPAAAKAREDDQLHIVAYDFGIKRNILRRLASYNCRITVVPASFKADDVLAMNPDGIFFSNGPGDPSAVPYAVEECAKLLGKKPAFGICMGHQVMGQAMGGKTFKLKFGHHGGNHPIRNEMGKTIEISAQNHNFAVDPETLPADVKVTHVNLNDGTCAGMFCEAKQAVSIQYHPEASPGPHDSDVCFDLFVKMVRDAKKAGAAV
ncbi:unnamed protein product [Pedinophyceae sp. YPF-701]|nr:unnamed protein product [Pedinophyceae sp. YPF-701]